MNVKESIFLALDSLRLNKLRAFLALLSISIGVFAIIGAGTLVSSLNGTVDKQLEEIGESTFWIQKMPDVVTGSDWHKYMRRKSITYSQVRDLRQSLSLTDRVSGAAYGRGFQIKAGDNSTDPNVSIIGADNLYFETMNVDLSEGRPFSPDDITQARNVAIIGNDILVKVFPNQDPIGKKITIKNHSFTVIGILKIKGGVMGQSQDNYCYIPITNFLRYYSNRWEESVTITIKAPSKALTEETIEETIGLFRSIRNLKPWQENDFELMTNETISEQFGPFMSFLTYFGFFCGTIALIAAGVGIMNIMLVSVKERTREIGIRKAIGARKSWILMQFIIETITLCQIGGLIGILLGMLGGWALGAMAQMTVVFPLNWIIIAIVICTILGIISGAYPAWKASKLDPIDALRYE